MISVERAKTFGRWVTLGPGAVLATYGTYFIVALVNRLTLFWVGLNPNWLLCRIYVEALTGFLMGFVFVYIATRIAPQYRRTVALTSAGIALLLTGAVLFAALLAEDYWALWQGASCAAGSCAAAYSVFQGELLSDGVSSPAAPAR